ncbi:hypothetical protein ACIQPQ_14060 [Streptomyces sp. NPDC091281]|uniref:hypothetical protein n=1 Tax=Streptomyces sp. NPDC091281 TaxID=3365985 RepID=UPI00382DF778
MTDVTTEPVALPAPPDTPSLPPPEPSTPAPVAAVAELDHTPGGWPVVPLAVSGTNTTVGMVAAASLAGGPLAAVVAATGAAVLAVAAASRSRKPGPRREARRTAARTAGQAAGRAAARTAARTGTTATGRNRAASAPRSGRSGPRGSGKVPGPRHLTSAAHRAAGPVGNKDSRGATGSKRGARSPLGRATAGSGFGSRAAGRAGQVRALRAAQQAAGSSRAERRAQTTAARRAVADARRNAPASGPGPARRHGGRSGKGGAVGRMLGGSARKARAVRDAAVARERARRDAGTGRHVDAKRSTLRKAPARKAARAALRRSASRFQRRRLLAALLALPLGLLGFLSSPIGRKLGIPALVHPGRSLYRRLTGAAEDERAAADDKTRERLAAEEAAADAAACEDGTDGVADTVERPAPHTPTTHPSPVSGGLLMSTSTSGFKFEDHAVDMQAAALLYEPDGCMEILAMVEGLPEALRMIAHVMQILAERSDSEFPLEKEVASGFNDIHELLRKAAEGAEELPGVFRRVHAQDIARHEDPRNGTQAEKGWNV